MINIVRHQPVTFPRFDGEGIAGRLKSFDFEKRTQKIITIFVDYLDEVWPSRLVGACYRLVGDFRLGEPPAGR